MSKQELKIIGLLSLIIVLSILGAMRNYWEPDLKLAMGPMYYVILIPLALYSYYRFYKREKVESISRGIPLVRPAVTVFSILSFIVIAIYLYFGIARGNV